MKKKYGKIISLIFMILFFIFLQTIVYSAFSSTMNLTGTAHARIEKDVRITDFKLISTKGASSFYEQFSVDTVSAGTSILSNESEREIIYEVEVTNYGSTDVGILNITGMPNNLSYELIDYKLQDKICDESNKCTNFAVKTFQIKITGNPGDYEFTLKFDFRTYHKVTYTDIENKGYPIDIIDGGDLNITFKEELKRILIISNNVEIAYYNKILNNQTITINNINNDIQIQMKEQVVKLVSGSINKVGSEVCIKNECFYIIDNDGETVTMLAKYNLHIGNYYDGTVNPLTNPTGVQNSKAIGWFAGRSKTNPIIGSIAFTEYENNYWSSTTSSYPKYVYDNNSIIYNYLENYKTTLTNYNVEISNIRLIDVNELVNLGCSTTSKTCTSSNYSWLYSTSYWTGSASSEFDLWNILSDGKLNEQWTMHDFSTDNDTIYLETAYSMLHGARPVIELSIDEIYIPPVVTIVSGDIDTVGSEICIKNECFYLISSNEDSVTMLTKYNLYVGGKYDNSTWTAYGDEATGIQNSTMLGWILNQTTRNGPSAFSTTNYWITTVETYPAYVYNSNSTLYNYVENYKTYLEKQGATVEEARLIKVEELEKLGCSRSTSKCENAQPWIYSTSYWTGDAPSNASLWRIDSGGGLSNISYTYAFNYGTRPVITIPKSLF